MQDLRQIALFAGLSETELSAIEARLETHVFPAGSTICRQGDLGQRLYIVTGGGVRVLLPDSDDQRKGELYFGPGGVFGEMSLLSGMPVAATVIAARRTELLALDKDAFHNLLQTHPSLYASLTKLLVERVRHRSSLSSNTLLPSCAVIAVPDSPAAKQLAHALFCGIAHYAPQSVCVHWQKAGARHDTSAAVVPEFFPTTDAPVHGVAECEYSVSAADSWWEELISNWRNTACMDQFLVLVVPREKATMLRSSLRDRDAVLLVEDDESKASTPRQATTDSHFGLADSATITVLHAPRTPHLPGEWEYSINAAEIRRAAQALHEAEWSTLAAARKPPNQRVIDRVVRWITRREIGIALGSGSARGFAHLAILEAIEREGIPIDYACGTSIGGIIAAFYGYAGSAVGATQMAREYIASNRKVRDVMWLRLPRSSIMAGEKVRRQATALFGDTTLADFHLPTATVAADLIYGDRVVIDRGPAVEAVLATSAIPGIYPPIVRGEKVLVDGGIVSQVPADLLLRRRCGLRLAVNVAPAPDATRPTPQECADFQRRLTRPFGFFGVLERSWDLLAWWHGASDAGAADIFLEPTTDRRAGGSFDSIDEMLDFGKRAAEERIETIRTAAQNALRPGTP